MNRRNAHKTLSPSTGWRRWLDACLTKNTTAWMSALALGLAGASPESRGESLPPKSAQTVQVAGVTPSGLSLDAIEPEHEVPGGGVGFLTQLGHIAGQTVGRDDSLTHVGLAPYVFVEESMLFGDLRMYRTNEGRTGGNLGLGWRHYFNDLDSIFGVAGYYDNDDSRGARFQQLGLSLEYLTRYFDVRGNWYVPIDDTERIVSTNIVQGSATFVDHFLTFDRRTVFGSAADGFDLTLSTPIPGEIPEALNWEASAGIYHFQVRDSNIDKMWGWKLRTDVDLFKRILHMYTELTSDNVIDTNVIFGASVNYYHGFENRRRLHDSQFYRMSEWVRRNYNVVTIDDAVITEDEIARNPATGDPYYFEHVRNIPGAPVPPPLPTDQPPYYNFPAPFGDGTIDRPFQFIQEAQAALQGSAPIIRDNGVIYVHGNSVFTGDNAVIEMNDGEIILGEGPADGVVQTLPVLGFQQDITLPVVIPNSNRPVLSSATGDAVTAASDNVFAGFEILNPAGNGITIDTQVNGTFRDVLITNAAGDGVSMFGANDGTFTFERVQIVEAAGVGFHVDGGNAQITVTDQDNVTLGGATIINSVNEALLIENTAGGFVNLAQTLIDDNGGAGIRLINNAGAVTIGQATLDDTTTSDDPDSVGAGLEIRGSTGITTLLSNIQINNASGVGLLMADLAASGRVNAAGNITVNSRNHIGADFDNIDGIVQFSPSSSLGIGLLNGATDEHPGIRFSNGSAGQVILQDFSVANSLAEGVLIGDSSGTGARINDAGAAFRVLGFGTINATSGAAFMVRGADGLEEPSVVESRGQLTSNTRVTRGLHIEDTSGTLNFSGATIVNNNAAVLSPFAALFVDDAAGNITFGSFTANSPTNGGLVPDVFEPGEFEPAIDIQNVTAPSGIGFGNLVVNDAFDTTVLDVDDTSIFFVQNGTIEVDGDRAIEIERTRINMTMTSVSSADSPDFGIVIVNSPGSFIVTGDGVTLSSGGVISGAGIAGAVFNDTDLVNLRFQEYSGNGVGVPLLGVGGPIVVDNLVNIVGSAGAGIVAVNMNEEDDFLFMDEMLISDNAAQGVYTSDVRNVEIEDSTFTDNGAAGVIGTQQHINLNVRTNPNPDDLAPTDPDFEFFTFVVERNLFLDTAPVAGDDALLIQTLTANAEGAGLELFVLDNEFSPFDRNDVTVAGVNLRPAAIELSWNGTLGAEIRRNTINMGDGNGQTGIAISTQGSNTRKDIIIANNLITAAGDGDEDSWRGMDIDLIGPANLSIASNEINFLTPVTPLIVDNNFGLRLRFVDGNKNVDITNNLILMDSGTGIGVPLVASPNLARSSFFISGNQIGSATRIPDQGIIFSAITGTVLLSGNANNVIFSSGPAVFFNGNTQGSIPVVTP